MPHITIAAQWNPDLLISKPPEGIERWGRAVLKTEHAWLRADRQAVLVEGVVVEFARPLHPIAQIVPHERGVIVRLWAVKSVERTLAVQRWLAGVAEWVRALTKAPVVTTNLNPEALAGYSWNSASRSGDVLEDAPGRPD